MLIGSICPRSSCRRFVGDTALAAIFRYLADNRYYTQVLSNGRLNSAIKLFLPQRTQRKAIIEGAFARQNPPYSAIFRPTVRLDFGRRQRPALTAGRRLGSSAENACLLAAKRTSCLNQEWGNGDTGAGRPRRQYPSTEPNHNTCLDSLLNKDRCAMAPVKLQ